jgi:hypothetical protein
VTALRLRNPGELAVVEDTMDRAAAIARCSAISMPVIIFSGR